MEFFLIIVGLIIYFIPTMVAYDNKNASTVFLGKSVLRMDNFGVDYFTDTGIL